MGLEEISDEEELQERPATAGASAGSRVVDKYEYDNTQAAWLEETRNQLTIYYTEDASGDRIISEENLIKSTQQWLELSRDFFQKYGTQKSYLDIFDDASRSIAQNRDVDNARAQFEYVKPLFQRRFRELNLNMTMIPNRGPFREGGEQRLPAAGQAPDS